VELRTSDPREYLHTDEIVDGSHPEVAALATRLRREHANDASFAAATFEFVRDSIPHSWDAQDRRVTLSASQTLRERIGLCYSKARLLAAVLRAERVPAGLCYQRLTDDGERFALHGLVAIHLHGSWHRLDPRGNKPGINAQFSLDTERLAWQARPEHGERDYPDVFIAPHPTVLAAFKDARDMLALCSAGLPSELLETSPPTPQPLEPPTVRRDTQPAKPLPQ
jgi:transglutaminase-like putative cysteine protease